MSCLSQRLPNNQALVSLCSYYDKGPIDTAFVLPANYSLQRPTILWNTSCKAVMLVVIAASVAADDFTNLFKDLLPFTSSFTAIFIGLEFKAAGMVDFDKATALSYISRERDLIGARLLFCRVEGLRHDAVKII